MLVIANGIISSIIIKISLLIIKLFLSSTINHYIQNLTKLILEFNIIKSILLMMEKSSNFIFIFNFSKVLYYSFDYH